MRRRVETTKGNFAAVINAFMASDKFNRLAPKTQANYRPHLLRAGRPEILGSVPVETMRPALVQAYLDGLSRTPGQQYVARAAIKAVEKWAIVRDLIPFPISTGTEARSGGGGYVPWDDLQVALAERASPPHLSRVITLASNTGQRGSDLIKMRWSDIEEYEGRLGINVTQQKTGLVIWVPMTQELQRAMATWERRPTFLLLKADGSPFTRVQLTNQWLWHRDHDPALAPIKDLSLVLHGLRATAVVRLRRAGATTGQIAGMVGMSEAMVNRYCRHSVQRENALAAVHYLDGRTREAPDHWRSSDRKRDASYREVEHEPRDAGVVPRRQR